MTENRAQPLTGTEQQLTVAPCLHRQREFVGSNHGALFQRCLFCNSVLVSQSGRVWVFPPKPQ
jgi:hypothetical protein